MSNKSLPVIGSVLVLLFAVIPAGAWAHGSLPGMEGFYIGALHPLTTIPHILLILALILFLSFRARGERKQFALAASLTCVAGLFVGLFTGFLFTAHPLSIIAAGILGVIVASAWATPAKLTLVLLSLTTFALGVESAPEPGRFGPVVVTSLGSFFGIIYLIFGGLHLCKEALKRWQALWLRIGIRVIGSWISAVSILMLAFILSGA